MSRVADYLSARLESGGFRIGQIVVRPGIYLRHVGDAAREEGLAEHFGPDAALEIARYDAAGAYRPLKTAPNLARGWELRVRDAEELRQALDFFYPAAVGAWLAYLRGELEPVALRETLERQTGMYRVTRLISDAQADRLNCDVCNSESGCLRRVLWRVDAGRPAPRTEERVEAGPDEIPLLCAEACNLLVAEARPLGKEHLPGAKEG